MEKMGNLSRQQFYVEFGCLLPHLKSLTKNITHTMKIYMVYEADDTYFLKTFSQYLMEYVQVNSEKRC
jgi:GR25 family glycosyltransferase involved in LPS biosynthesis